MSKNLYSDEIRVAICEKLAEGKSLTSLCKQPGYPSPSTVLRWVKDNSYPGFAEEYTQARKIGYELLGDVLLDIADDDSQDTISTSKGDKEDKEWTSRSRLKVDTRKWMLSKMLPKVYGEKLTLAGDAENPIVTSAAADTSKLSVEELETYLLLVRKMNTQDDPEK